MVESQPSKLLVAGSIPVSRSRLRRFVGVSEAGARSRNPERSLRGNFGNASCVMLEILQRQKTSLQDDNCLEMTVGFEKAAIKVEKVEDFSRLQTAVEQAFLPEKAESFLKQLDRKGIRVRDFDAVLAKRVLESVVTAELGARQLYEALPVSDQAQMREFYLSKLEGVEVALRHKFKKLYQYY